MELLFSFVLLQEIVRLLALGLVWNHGRSDRGFGRTCWYIGRDGFLSLLLLVLLQLLLFLLLLLCRRIEECSRVEDEASIIGLKFAETTLSNAKIGDALAVVFFLLLLLLINFGAFRVILDDTNKTIDRDRLLLFAGILTRRLRCR